MGGSESQCVGGGYRAVGLALKQPFPNLIWRFDFAALIDLQGGLLMQPALRWKPSGSYTIDVFYIYLNGHLAQSDRNIIGSVDYADEIGLRLGYQF